MSAGAFFEPILTYAIRRRCARRADTVQPDRLVDSAASPQGRPADPDAARSAYAAAKHHVLQHGPDCEPSGRQSGAGPDALCIGAQKAATTWLFNNLGYHPLVWLPPIKELNFFTSVHLLGHRADDARHLAKQIREARTWWEHAVDRPSERSQRLALLDHIATERLSTDWYRGIFDFRGPDQIGLDISPEYCLLPREGIRHALAINPNVRVIALLRDPVDRALSHAAMLAGDDADEAGVWRILASEALGVLIRYSDYPRWLGRWRGLVPAGSMFVATMRQVRMEPHALLGRICAFLGVPFHADLFPAAAEPVFTGRRRQIVTPAMREFLRERMERVYRELEDQWPDLAAEFADQPTHDHSRHAELREEIA